MKTYIKLLTVFFYSFFNSTVAQAPTDLQIDGANTDSVNENRLVGAVVGVLTSTDSSTVDQHTYTLVTGIGDTDNAFFSIDGDRLLTNAVFDFETKNSYSIRVRTTDTTSQTYAVRISSGGCEVLSDCHQILANETLNVSQGFSLNGDGINDTWFIGKMDAFPNAEVLVFNRSFQVVFEARNGYKNDWTGSWKNGGQLPSGSYFYTIDREGDGIVDQYGWLYIQN